MKRVLRMVSLVLVLTMLLSVSAMAATLGPGFYGFGKSNTAGEYAVKIEAQDASGGKIEAQTAKLDETKTTPYYEGAVKLAVTCTVADAEDDQFLVLLMDYNNQEIPLVTDTIYYIDQTAGTVEFNVYPLLPEEETDMMLYITSNKDGFNTMKIPVSYTPESKYEVAPYTLGDVNLDGSISVSDVLAILDIIVGKLTPTETQRLAANTTQDATGDITVNDALYLLDYLVGKREF